jgi:hypothetical protein
MIILNILIKVFQSTGGYNNINYLKQGDKVSEPDFQNCLESTQPSYWNDDVTLKNYYSYNEKNADVDDPERNPNNQPLL